MIYFLLKRKACQRVTNAQCEFAIKHNLVNQRHELPVGTSEHLMTVSPMLASSQIATVVGAQAPTLDAQPGVKEAFDAEDRPVFSLFPL